MAAYTTLEQVQAELAREIDPGKRERVDALIANAMTLVDSETGRTWQLDAEAESTARRFECVRGRVMRIDPATEIESVDLCELNSITTALTEGLDWTARPGGSGEGVTPETIRRLERLGANWPGPPAYLEVTAVWAEASTVPADIALATAYIVAAQCRAQGIGSDASAEVKSESWGDYSVTRQDTTKSDSPRAIPPEAERILARYRDGNDDSTFAIGV